MSVIRCEDWRDAPLAQLRPLYAAEIDRWRSQLEWDAESNFEQVELGRQLGHVRGWLALDKNGTIAGWCFCLERDGHLQVGGFTASSKACSDAMLAAIFDRDEVSSFASTFFTYSDAPGLAAALRTRGHAVDRYFYMGRALAVSAVYPPRDARRWNGADRFASAELMKRAYPDVEPARPFAPNGDPHEWLEYVTLATTATGCGSLVEDACLSLPYGPERLSALALVTRISPTTAHLVQLAVDPSLRRRHLGSTLLSAACTRAFNCGFRRMTMMVSGRNAAARRLYEGAGFDVVTSFVSAGKGHPLRSTSVAGKGVAASLR
jgi:ribosomal protein S18 acetylase RimI-like enzyme